MENETSHTEKASGHKSIFIGIALVVVVVIAVLVYQNSSMKGTEESVVETPEASAPNTDTTNMSAYKDGTYTADGEYISPGGAETVGVTVTLVNGVVTDSVFVVKAERPTSVTMQQNFAGGYKEFVVGKNIDEISVTKVSGSSLTPGGFMDALEKIKAQAQA